MRPTLRSIRDARLSPKAPIRTLLRLTELSRSIPKRTGLIPVEIAIMEVVMDRIAPKWVDPNISFNNAVLILPPAPAVNPASPNRTIGLIPKTQARIPVNKGRV